MNKIAFAPKLAAAALASAVATCLTAPPRASANVFNMSSPDQSLLLTTIGDPGNAKDATNRGAVAYSYQMGVFDVTAAQYTQFLNAVAQTDPYGLYNPAMATTSVPSAGAGITRSGSAGSYSYSTMTGRDNEPVNYISWGDAARFCNWLYHGQPATGGETSSTTETGSYTLNGATSDTALAAITRNPAATYVIPSSDEWYKAAYYKGGSTNAGYWQYQTQSNTAPSNIETSNGLNNANYNNGSYTSPSTYITPVGTFAGSPGAYGTFDMGGDVFQWEEDFELGGGDYNLGAFYLDSQQYVDSEVEQNPSGEFNYTGFRIVDLAPIPEPASLLLLALGTVSLLPRRRRPLR